jgi:uridylate kinase
MSALRWRRLLLKISGEALMGDSAFGIEQATVDRIAAEVAEVVGLGAELGLVVGGGNFLRGATMKSAGADRVIGDHMGMLATVINCLALDSALKALGVRSVVVSALPVPTVCESFTQRDALGHMAKGKVVLFAGGTGNPFFTTDTGAALRAAEMGCEALLKGTNVDGVYSADPNLDATARRYERLTHQDVLERNLKVMDATSIALARDNDIPIIVFSIKTPGALVEVVQGRGRATEVAD